MRNKVSAIRFSDEEYELLKEKASKSNMTISEYVRYLTLKIKPPKKKRSLKDCKQYNILIYEINKIGNNINQIARYCNKSGYVDIKTLEELEKIQSQLLSVLDRLEELTEKEGKEDDS